MSKHKRDLNSVPFPEFVIGASEVAIAKAMRPYRNDDRNFPDWKDDLQMEVMSQIYEKLRKQPDADRHLLIWLAKGQFLQEGMRRIRGDRRFAHSKGRLADATGYVEDLQDTTEGEHSDHPLDVHVSVEDVDSPTQVARNYGLQGRHAYIAARLAEGAQKQEIAAELGISRGRMTVLVREVGNQIASA